MEEDEESVINDLEKSEIILDQLTQYTLLSEMVRNHYSTYLEKQLQENIENAHITEELNEYIGNVRCKNSIKETAKSLEEKAIKACMIAQLYQRAMVKIISIVKRSTNERKLFKQLENIIVTHGRDSYEQKTFTKETQTDEAGLQTTDVPKRNAKENLLPQQNTSIEDIAPTGHISRCSSVNNDEVNNDADDIDEKPVMSLDEKIKKFQEHLHQEQVSNKIKKYSTNREISERIKSNKYFKKSMRRRYHKITTSKKSEHKNYVSSSGSKPQIVMKKHQESSNTCNKPIASHHTVISKDKELSQAKNVQPSLNTDSVDLELARLFCEEKTELDEIFGIDPNEQTDDPQICKILKEIEESHINHSTARLEQSEVLHSLSPACNDMGTEGENTPHQHQHHGAGRQQHSHLTTTMSPKLLTNNVTKDLCRSLWPCELFRQKRKLSDILARLIEEDLRWHDILKWKFYELFGEDSDDEFVPCSPSIELDDIVMSSCIRRISPWIVKHLMKPMNDGLIGNRFLFKKLAKHLARSIITENQYPDESLIRLSVENFFCINQAVMSLDDLADIPSISLLND